MSESAPRAGVVSAVLARALWPWAAVTVVLTVCLSSCFIIHDVGDRVAQLFQPKAAVQNILHGTIDDIRREAKLVVTSADLTPEVERKEEYRWWIVYFGTTTGRIRAPGSHVQYIIPLDSFSAANIELRPRQKLIRVHFPRPRLDESMVDVNTSQLEEYKVSAWSRFNKEEVAAEARAMLREATLAAGRHAWVQEFAATSAKPRLERLLAPLAGALADGVRLEVQFDP